MIQSDFRYLTKVSQSSFNRSSKLYDNLSRNYDTRKVSRLDKLRIINLDNFNGVHKVCANSKNKSLLGVFRSGTEFKIT